MVNRPNPAVDRGPGPNSGAVSGVDSVRLLLARVRAARRALLAARAGEGALLAACALGLSLSAAVVSGAGLESAAAWIAAALCAALAAATWWLEMSLSAPAVARRIDRRLAAGGELSTAYECALRGMLTPVARSLVARAASASRRRMIEAVLPRSLPFVALPFLGAAALALALDVGRVDLDRSALPSLTTQLSAELAGLAEAASSHGPGGGPSPDLERERSLRELSSRAKSLARRAREGGLGAAPAERELAEIGAVLGKLARRADLQRDLAQGLARARTLADSARRASAAARDRSPRTGVPGSPPEAPLAAPGERDVTGAGAEGTMSRRGASSTLDPTGDAAVSGPPPAEERGAFESPGFLAGESGVIAGRWWDPRYDRLIDAWSKARLSDGR